MRSHAWAVVGKGYDISHKAAKSMANHFSSQSFDELQQAVCLSMGDAFIQRFKDDLITQGCLTGL